MKKEAKKVKLNPETPQRRYRLDHEGTRRLVRVHDGVECYVIEYTAACTGCTDFGDYGMQYGPFGCEECGYTGKRRERHLIPFNLEEGPSAARAVAENVEQLNARRDAEAKILIERAVAQERERCAARALTAKDPWQALKDGEIKNLGTGGDCARVQRELCAAAIRNGGK